MALNAFGMVIQEVAQVASNAAPKMTEKQARATMSKQRQAQGKAQTAARDRQRAASRAAQAQRSAQTRSQRSAARKEDRIARGKKESPHEQMQKRINKQVKEFNRNEGVSERPDGKANGTEKITWLNRYSGEEREAREEELMQSLKAAGHYTFKGANGENMWIENVESEDSWKPDYSRATGEDYKDSAYENLLKRNTKAASVEDIDFDIFG